jgi:hypothetical protein
MVVYIDGKPIFVQNPKTNEHTQDEKQFENVLNSINRLNESEKRPVSPRSTSAISSIRKKCNTQPIAKIPFLLAAAAAAATTNRNNTMNRKEGKYDQEYQQLVSMFKQKNEKLHNPLASNNIVQNTH